jgi:hypothetical protein
MDIRTKEEFEGKVDPEFGTLKKRHHILNPGTYKSVANHLFPNKRDNRLLFA